MSTMDKDQVYEKYLQGKLQPIQEGNDDGEKGEAKSENMEETTSVSASVNDQTIATTISVKHSSSYGQEKLSILSEIRDQLKMQTDKLTSQTESLTNAIEGLQKSFQDSSTTLSKFIDKVEQKFDKMDERLMLLENGLKASNEEQQGLRQDVTKALSETDMIKSIGFSAIFNNNDSDTKKKLSELEAKLNDLLSIFADNSQVKPAQPSKSTSETDDSGVISNATTINIIPIVTENNENIVIDEAKEKDTKCKCFVDLCLPVINALMELLKKK